MTLLADHSVGIKLGRLEALMDAGGVEALRITQGGNLAWLSGGGDFLVSQTGAPVAEMLLYKGKLTLVTTTIEAVRLEQEELPAGVEVRAYDWFDEREKERLIASIVGKARIKDDRELDLYPARVPLLEAEQGRFRELGGLASTTLTDALTGLTPGLSEKEVAARVKSALEARGLACPVLLVAGQERLGKYRHPIPKGEPFGAVGLIVVCAQARGLVVSLSRMVAFGEVPAVNRDRLERVLAVERAVWDKTQPGTPVHEVMKAAQDAYAQVGYPDAWKEHHQGGPAGYFPRDFLATPRESRPVLEGVAYAWNPSLPHAKAEDTVLLTSKGLENLSFDPRWPSLEVGGRPRPDILVIS